MVVHTVHLYSHRTRVQGFSTLPLSEGISPLVKPYLAAAALCVVLFPMDVQLRVPVTTNMSKFT